MSLKNVTRLLASLDCELQNKGVQACLEQGARAVPFCIRNLKTSNPRLWQNSVLVLTKIGAESVPTITKLFKSKYISVRRGAAAVIASFGPTPEVVAELTKLLTWSLNCNGWLKWHDPHQLARVSICDCMSQMKEPPAELASLMAELYRRTDVIKRHQGADIYAGLAAYRTYLAELIRSDIKKGSARARNVLWHIPKSDRGVFAAELHLIRGQRDEVYWRGLIPPLGD